MLINCILVLLALAAAVWWLIEHVRAVRAFRELRHYLDRIEARRPRRAGQ